MEGGCANDYAYISGDPVNYNDLSGMYSSKGCKKIFKKLLEILLVGHNALLGRAERAQDAGHLKAFNQRQNPARDELDKWDRGGSDDWPGGDGEIISYIRNLATVSVPTASDIATPGNLGDVAGQYLSSGGGSGWGPIGWIAGGLAALAAGIATVIRMAGSICESGICYA